MVSNSERGSHRVEPKRVTFADERTRRTMEIMQELQHLQATLPPLPIPKDGYDLTPISFSEELKHEGATVLLHLGEYMDRETFGEGETKLEVSFVQPRTIQLLDALQIPYTNHAAIEPPQE